MALCETTMSMSLQFTINATLKIPGALVFLSLMVLFHGVLILRMEF
jgi:hypothetical protein